MRNLSTEEMNAVCGAGSISPWNSATPWQSGEAGSVPGEQLYNEYKDGRWSKTFSAIRELIHNAAAENPIPDAGFSGEFSAGGYFIGGR